MPARRPSREAVEEATDVLRRVLKAIEDGELEVRAGSDVAFVRRLEGALAALEAAGGRRPPEPRSRPEKGS